MSKVISREAPCAQIARRRDEVAAPERERATVQEELHRLEAELTALDETRFGDYPGMIGSEVPAPTTAAEKVALFRFLSRSRDDVYPKLWVCYGFRRPVTCARSSGNDHSARVSNACTAKSAIPLQSDTGSKSRSPLDQCHSGAVDTGRWEDLDAGPGELRGKHQRFCCYGRRRVRPRGDEQVTMRPSTSAQRI